MALSEQIIQHVESCILEQCTCRDFCSAIKNRHLYPLVPEHWGVKGARGETWLDGTVDRFGVFGWCCLPCASAQLRQTSNTYRERGAHAVKAGNLTRHQESDAHKEAVCFCLDIDRSDILLKSDTEKSADLSPPTTVFEQIFRKFKGGEAPDKGYDLGSHVVAQHKAEKVLWMLHEAITEDKRTCLSNATIINLMRDERALKEHIRFRCCNEDADLTTGFLGQALLDPSSIGINKATHEVIKNVCTKWHAIPAHLKPIVQPCLDASTCEAICKKVKAISTDSAENEIAATRDLSVASSFLSDDVFILRDNCHSARRVLSRPWKADEVLSNLIGFLFFWKSSLGQLMHHSHILSNLYKQCVRDCPSASTVSLFGTLRTAKHRFESQMTPLIRIVLNPEAFLMFAILVAVQRKGTAEGNVAEVFLQTITFDMFLLAAMMADAGAETLNLIRVLDTEDRLEVAAICQIIEQFLNNITWLFHEDGCMRANSYTKAMVTWLARPHFFLANGIGKVLGGGPPTDADLAKCFGHMRSFTLLARDVLDAEFPNFDVVCAFSAFACIEKGKRITDVVTTKLARLARAFKAPNLIPQFKSMFDSARKQLYEDGGTFDLAWVYAVRSWRCYSRSCKDTDDLQIVLRAMRVFLPCTSKIEQSFAIISKVFGSHRLNMGQGSENMAVSILMADLSGSGLHKICERARELWITAFGQRAVRMYTSRQVDYNIPRTKPESSSSKCEEPSGLPTERAFRKRIHSEIITASSAEGVNHFQTLGAYQPPVGTWTPAHEAEREFNIKKLNAKRVDAHLHGLILPHESDPALHTGSQNEIRRRGEAFMKRLRDMQKLEGKQRAFKPQLTRNRVFFHEGSAALNQSLAEKSCLVVTEHCKADVFVMDNPFEHKSPSDRRVQWAAALMGRPICATGVYTCGWNGPWIHLKRALNTRRIFWASSLFQDTCPVLWTLVLSILAEGDHKWKVLTSMDEFLQARLKHGRTPTVIGLCTNEECDRADASGGVAHLYSPSKFLKFIHHIDESCSALGVGQTV